MTFTQQSRDVVCWLVKNKLELSICLIHLISFQETEASSSQQMVLWKWEIASLQLQKHSKTITVIATIWLCSLHLPDRTWWSCLPWCTEEWTGWWGPSSHPCSSLFEPVGHNKLLVCPNTSSGPSRGLCNPGFHRCVPPPATWRNLLSCLVCSTPTKKKEIAVRFLCSRNPNKVALHELDTHSESDPYVQLRVLLFEDTDDFISFRKLIEVELNNLRMTWHETL